MKPIGRAFLIWLIAASMALVINTVLLDRPSTAACVAIGGVCGFAAIGIWSIAAGWTRLWQ